jgi:hypothetical protein
LLSKIKQFEHKLEDDFNELKEYVMNDEEIDP